MPGRGSGAQTGLGSPLLFGDELKRVSRIWGAALAQGDPRSLSNFVQAAIKNSKLAALGA